MLLHSINPLAWWSPLLQSLPAFRPLSYYNFFLPLQSQLTAVLLKTTLLAFVLALTGASIAAQEAKPSSTATLYVMRSSGSIGGLEAFNTFINDTLACRLNNKSYTVHSLPVGTHQLKVRANGKQAKNLPPLSIAMEAGERYYVTVNVKHQAFTGAIYLTEVTVNTANKILPDLKQDTHCK
jgi:hypothetical protein